MTFPRRGTRVLVVEGRRFLWHMSPKDIDYGALATIGVENGRGILHYWPADDFPSPREAAEIVRFALSHGWSPDDPGPPLWLDRDGETWSLSERRVER